MALYLPPSFTAAANVGRQLAADFPFATLITPQPDGAPWISHLPLLADPEHADCLLGHIACANGHAAALAGSRSVALFQGEHGYISPRWYVRPGMVPTWNYRVAHAEGEVEILSAEALVATLGQLAAAFEGEAGWSLAQLPAPALAAMSRAIIGFRLRVTCWRVKEKLSQNRAPQDVVSLIAALAGGDAAAQALAARMQAVAR